ncbi:MAG: rhodanese-like domain-containing protein [Acidimicrobiales bacterium]
MYEPATVDEHQLRRGLAAGELIAIMTMSEAAFASAHIPGSVALTSVSQAKAHYAQDAPLVVYCTDLACRASLTAFRQLVDAGFTNVRHYPGGLSDWTAAGYPIEGTQQE